MPRASSKMRRETWSPRVDLRAALSDVYRLSAVEDRSQPPNLDRLKGGHEFDAREPSPRILLSDFVGKVAAASSPAIAPAGTSKHAKAITTIDLVFTVDLLSVDESLESRY